MLTDKKIEFDGFIFDNFERVLGTFLYQYVKYSQYIVDINTYEVIILNITDEKKNNTISFCLHVNLTDIPLAEIDSITAEILDKIFSPIVMVYESWSNSYITV